MKGTYHVCIKIDTFLYITAENHIAITKALKEHMNEVERCVHNKANHLLFMQQLMMR